jgi:hypothetical protein
MSSTFLSERDGLPSLRLHDADGEGVEEEEVQAKVSYHKTRAKQMGLIVTLKELLDDPMTVLETINPRQGVLPDEDETIRVYMQKSAVGDCLEELTKKEEAVAFVEKGGLAIIDRCLYLESVDAADGDQICKVLYGLETILKVGKEG